MGNSNSLPSFFVTKNLTRRFDIHCDGAFLTLITELETLIKNHKIQALDEETRSLRSNSSETGRSTPPSPC